MSDLPHPYTPKVCDVRGLDMLTDIDALEGSDFMLLSTPEEFKAAWRLWMRAWKQVPAASLSADDRVLANMAGYENNPEGWARVRARALHGFKLCSDGRLYHEVIAAKALIAFKSRCKQRKACERRHGRSGDAHDFDAIMQDHENSSPTAAPMGHPTASPQVAPTVTVTEIALSYPSDIRERGDADASPALADCDDDVAELFGKRAPAPSKPKAAKPKPSTKARYRIPDDWAPPSDMVAKCADKFGLEEWEIRAAVPEFIDHWQGVVASKAQKSDLGWRQAFNNQLARIIAYPSLRHALKTSDLAPAHARHVAPKENGHARNRNTGLAAATALRLLNGGIDEGAVDGGSARDGGENYPRLNAPAR